MLQGSVKYHGSYENIANLNPKIMDVLKSDEDKHPKNEDQKDDSDTVSQHGDESSVKSLEVSLAIIIVYSARLQMYI